MHNTDWLWLFLLFLLASVIAVPLFRTIKLGSILGYLAGGIIIGPSILGLVTDPVLVLNFSEIGVVLLLFVIGLELEPQKLWSMKKAICLLGGSQIIVCAALVYIALWFLLHDWPSALVIALALALSSTAFAVQLMAERGLMAYAVGRRGFSILLMQDLAVIPILFVVTLLGSKEQAHSMPWFVPLGVIIALVLVGRVLFNPCLGLVARFGGRETMVAASLLIVVGSAYLMHIVGLSMGLGAFLAGILLSSSSYKNQLASDIEPFKSITLGLFFMAIGMMLDFELFWDNPWVMLSLSILLALTKMTCIALLLRSTGVEWRQGIKVGIMLSQGGEFAFVIVAQALQGGLFSPHLAAQVNLVVGLSMALTSPFLMFSEVLLKPKPSTRSDQRAKFPDKEPGVLMLGFGRFVYSAARILDAHNIPFTAIDKDTAQISFAKRFGSKVHFGDATRLDVLQAAGIEQVKVLLVGLDNVKSEVEIVRYIKGKFPRIIIVARARDSSSYWALKAAGANVVIREVFKASLEAAEHTLHSMGYSWMAALNRVEEFHQRDITLLEDAYEYRNDLDELVKMSKIERDHLKKLFLNFK